mmetsp:Transcript_18474/g.46429  ORF Transcript_18474/g.46429 Transcript_18474/m.46429 type:complete len:87 (+) Transcript_18474:1062-1322(+)
MEEPASTPRVASIVKSKPFALYLDDCSYYSVVSKDAFKALNLEIHKADKSARVLGVSHHGLVNSHYVVIPIVFWHRPTGGLCDIPT